MPRVHASTHTHAPPHAHAVTQQRVISARLWSSPWLDEEKDVEAMADLDAKHERVAAEQKVDGDEGGAGESNSSTDSDSDDAQDSHADLEAQRDDAAFVARVTALQLSVEAGRAGKRVKASPTILIPGGKALRISKQTLIKELLQCMEIRSRGDASVRSIPTDRLKRINALAKRAKESPQDCTYVDGDYIELHSDIALRFYNSRTKKHDLVFGRVQKLRKKMGTRFNEWLYPVSASAPPTSLRFICSYYNNTHTRGTYIYGGRRRRAGIDMAD